MSALRRSICAKWGCIVDSCRDRSCVAAVVSSLACLSLTACGGGGTSPVASAGSAPVEVVAPPAAPTPPPPPPPPSTAALPTPSEYAASIGASAAHASYAYDAGYTGKGVTIAVIDSGIATASPEFAGRISAASKSFGTANVEDVQGHGTRVASIAAAAANGSQISGVANEATILAVKIASTDSAGRETGFNGLNVDNAISYAVNNGAFVMNLSVNGTSNSAGSSDLNAAMNAVRQGDRLLVQSVQNDAGDSFAGTISQALVGSNFANKDWFLYGLGLDANLNPVTANGSPGALADRTLAVASWGVYAVTQQGDMEKVYGNSFAAPVVAGAAALLKQYWPQLGGKDISAILLTSATDAGAPGVDQVYGAGILNIEAAFKARNPTLAAVSVEPSSVASTQLVFSPAFGSTAGQADFGQAAGTAVALDAFGRDYGVRVGALTGSTRAGGVSIASLAFDGTRRIAEASQADPRLGFASGLDGRAPALSNGRFSLALGRRLAVSGTVNGSIEESDAMTGSILRWTGLPTFGSKFELVSGGKAISFASARTYGRRGGSTRQLGIGLGSGFNIGLMDSVEQGSALGLRGSGAFAIQGARSSFASFGWRGDIGSVRLNGLAMAGRTTVRSPDTLIAFTGPVQSAGFHFDASRPMFGGAMLLGLTSPLKVERANLRYTRAVGYDVETRSLIDATSLIDLAPDARELDLELGWSRGFASGYLSLGGAYGFNSGNVAGRRSAGAWLRFGRSF